MKRLVHSCPLTVVAAVAFAGAGTVAAAELRDFRIPDDNLHARTAAATVSLEQVTNAYTMLLDSENAAGVAGLFTADGKISLWWLNPTGGPGGTQRLERTGRAPSSTPTGGAAGGGCSAAGTQQIINFLRGAGYTHNYRWPATQHTVMFSFAPMLAPDRKSATARAYIYNGNDQTNIYAQAVAGPQWLAEYRFDPAQGWQISEVRLVYTQKQDTYPCQN